jgi:hypothetical protein
MLIDRALADLCFRRDLVDRYEFPVFALKKLSRGGENSALAFLEKRTGRGGAFHRDLAQDR